MAKPLVTTCRNCGETKEKRLLTTRSLPSQKCRGVYVDLEGRRWHGGSCPTCANVPRKKGRTAYTPDTNPNPGSAKARRREWLVCEWIKINWGIDCEPSQKFNGPDITLPNGDVVEVKGVGKHATVCGLTPQRHADKWLALVWYETEVVMLSMATVFPRHVPPKSTICVGRFRPQQTLAVAS